MKRAAVVLLLALMMVFAVAPAAMPAPANPEASLKTLFNTYLNGAEAQGVATFVRGGQAADHAAASAVFIDTFGESEPGNGAIRLSPVPFWPNGPFCDTDVFGIWIVFFGPKIDLKGEVDEAILLDGVVLESKYTPLKPIFDPFGDWEDFIGEKGWWFSFGVPVYGSLDSGTYEVAYEFEGDIVLSNTVTVADCP